MFPLKTVSDFMHKSFAQVTVSKNGTHFHARCPLCGDSKKNERKKRFHLDWKNGQPKWHCFNCDEHGGFIRIYCRMSGCSYEEAKKRLLEYTPARGRNIAKMAYDNRPVKPQAEAEPDKRYFNSDLKNFVSHDFPVESVLTKHWLAIINKFVIDRKIPDKYPILYAWQGYFQGRLIVPIFDKNMNLIYFQARRIPGSDVDPKYKNPVAEKSSIILNQENFRNDRNIIVAEGLLDAFMVGRQGTTCLGKSLSDTFLKKLKTYTHENIIMCFDNDRDGKKEVGKFMESPLARMVKYFLMPEGIDSKDINMLCIEHDVKNVYSFITENSYSLRYAKAKIHIANRANLKYNVRRT